MLKICVYNKKIEKYVENMSFTETEETADKMSKQNKERGQICHYLG